MTEVFEAIVERKDPGLPRYVIVPAEAVDAVGGRAGTVVALCAIGGAAPVRRSVKPWGDGRWFLELTERQCRAAGIDTGDRVSLRLTPAPAMPEALSAALGRAGLTPAWEALPASERRGLAEAVFDARRPATAERRITAIVERLRRGG